VEAACSNEHEEGEYHVVYGSRIPPDEVKHSLATSLIAYSGEHGERDVILDAVYRASEGVEAVVMTMLTSAPQAPAYPILPTEQVAVFFMGESAPLVVPLRTRADYNGSELVRRIAKWFARTGSGRLNDPLQAPDFAFLPSPSSIIISTELDERLTSEEGQPFFVALRQAEEDSRTFEVIDFEDIGEHPAEGMEWVPHIGMAIVVKVNNQEAMWRPPAKLGHLRDSLIEANPDLLERLRYRITEILRDVGEHSHRLYNSRLIVRFYIDNVVAERIESLCLLTESNIGEIGVALGLLWPPDGDAGATYTTRIPCGKMDEAKLAATSLIPTNYFMPFNGKGAEIFSGRGKEWRQTLDSSAVVLGAGSIGSQVIDSMVREGAFSKLLIVDDDYLAPHNLARHTLRSSAIGRSKARSLAAELHDARPDLPVEAMHEKLGLNGPSEELGRALCDAKIFIDMTASVGASRQLSDISDRGRGACAFFNPMGDAVVTLVENKARSIDIAQLEALYYGEIVARSELHKHLNAPNVEVIGGGQCRATTNRMSSSSAAILSGIAARDLGTAFSREGAKLIVSTLSEGGSVNVVSLDPAGPSEQGEMNGWTARVSNQVVEQLRAHRLTAAPNETGGVLLGIVDYARQRIEVSIGLPAPADSQASPSSFERGVRGLRDVIDHARSATMYQLSYIGEWHTHPDNTCTDPSPVDCELLTRLRMEMKGEQRPAIMLIVGQSDSNLIITGSSR